MKTNRTKPAKRLKITYIKGYKEYVEDPFNLTHKNENYLNEVIKGANVINV